MIRGRAMAYHTLGALRTLPARTTARRMTGAAAAVLALALCTGLGACSSDPSWPTLGKVSDLTNVMTPEERQKALQDLQKGDQAQTGSTTGTPAKQGQ